MLGAQTLLLWGMVTLDVRKMQHQLLFWEVSPVPQSGEQLWWEHKTRGGIVAIWSEAPAYTAQNKRCQCALPFLISFLLAKNFQIYKSWAQLNILKAVVAFFQRCWSSFPSGTCRIPGSVTIYKTWMAHGCNNWEQLPFSEHKFMFLLECPNSLWQMSHWGGK